MKIELESKHDNQDNKNQDLEKLARQINLEKYREITNKLKQEMKS
jgi:triacylglycerol esterase/lipase EstA (alpha/beta hydrolase family)